MAVGGVFLVVLLARSDDYVSPSRATDIDYRLKSIVVSVDFQNATIEDATNALAGMSRQLDPSHRGIQFVVEPEAAAEGKPITLKLDKVPIREALRYTCILGGVAYHVDDYSVFIRPSTWEGQEMDKRTFHVDPDFVKAASSAGVIPPVQTP